VTSLGKGIIIDRTFLSAPTKLAPTQFKVGTGTNAPSLSDTDLQTAVLIDADQFKNFVSGFPTVDLINNEATTRMFLNTLEANGNTLTEMGVFNADGTEQLFSRATFSAVTKSSSNEVTFIQKDRMI